MLALVACLALVKPQSGFDWGITGEVGPLKDFSMTAKFTSNRIPFEGPVPEHGDVRVAKGGRAYARINVDFFVEQYGEGTEVWSNVCGNICQGPPPNHASHAECDRFCDRPCEITHRFETNAHDGFCGWQLDSVKQPFTEAFAEACDVFKNRGLPVDDNMDWLMSIRDDYISRANEKADNEKYVFEPKHVGQDPYLPCLWGKFTVTSRHERVTAQIKRNLVFEEQRGNEYVVVAEVPMGQDIFVPVTQGSNGIAGDIKETGVRCLCGNEQTSMFPELPAIGIGDRWRSFPVSNPGGGYQTLVRNMNWGMVNVAALGEDMNSCGFEVSGDAMARLYLPAGTLLVPNDSKSQVMMLMEDFNSSLVAGSTPWGSNVRAACTEMRKDEPTSKTKFSIVGPTDGNLKRLAGFTAKSRFRGPWDQVRIWIYTEGATYQEMEKKLIPMVAKPVYLQELDRVLDGGIDPAKRKKLTEGITLDMLSDFRCGVGGLSRALPVLWTRDPKKLMDAAPGYAAGWVKDSSAQGPEMAAILTNFLGLKKQPEARAAARTILSAIPENLRTRAVNRGGLESVSAGAFSKDKAEVKATVELLKDYKASMYAKTLAFGEGRLKLTSR